ncbi:hypothetical protein FK530_22570 [Tsukamurella conjunctivitidis]|uniref:Uncharacterized protein n=1 Tax=Tsukamurella conjunctivitidis TaxID=2592068 RepID=A0A5C5RS84_9ACTN|nr:MULTISPECIES: Rrf2 family transcriptional regulator [Tsukamurella]RDB48057.1 hypothetical protein DVB87_10040 [Tsukamurella tyrosinosolvens]TWS25624.1 hypothetical protein FK530_22570 [Tsukamurella conjunctivitidis]
MDEGELIVRQILSQTSPGQRVGSVDSICEATGLSTGGAIAVMKRLIEQGLVRSERGPKGGYWRTDAPVPAAGAQDELREIAKALESITARVNALIADANT